LDKLLLTFLVVLASTLTPSSGFAWGREGRHVTVILAMQYMSRGTAVRVRELLGSESLEEASFWADEYRHGHPVTGPWHYINIPLGDSRIDRAGVPEGSVRDRQDGGVSCRSEGP
jgi:hypothetical protein